MGQRTQILVQVKDKHGFLKNNMYHVQWGQGRILMMLSMKLIFNKELRSNDSIVDACKLSEDDGVLDITNTIPRELLKNVDIYDLESVKACFDECENEEGAMVIQIIDNFIQVNRIGFLLHDKKGISIVPKYVSLNKYIKEHGYCYVDIPFKKMFREFVKTMEVEIINI